MYTRYTGNEIASTITSKRMSIIYNTLKHIKGYTHITYVLHWNWNETKEKGQTRNETLQRLVTFSYTSASFIFLTMNIQ